MPLKHFSIAGRVLMLLACLGMSGCFAYRSAANLPRDVAILGDHARARSAMARGELSAAEGLLTSEKYRHRSREVAGMSWGELLGQAVETVLAAHARGETVAPEALFQAYMVGAHHDDLPTALDYMTRAQTLLDSVTLREPDQKRRNLVEQRVPSLILYRYLESGGQIDWTSEIEQGYYELYFRAPPPGPGAHDPRDFYRFLEYLTLEDRTWLFENVPMRAHLDADIWRDDARLHAFSRTLKYYEWYAHSGFEGRLDHALNWMRDTAHICAARQRGYNVVPRSEWGMDAAIASSACGPALPH